MVKKIFNVYVNVIPCEKNYFEVNRKTRWKSPKIHFSFFWVMNSFERQHIWMNITEFSDHLSTQKMKSFQDMVWDDFISHTYEIDWKCLQGSEKIRKAFGIPTYFLVLKHRKFCMFGWYEKYITRSYLGNKYCIS